jgi:hypothetical protein
LCLIKGLYTKRLQNATIFFVFSQK